jgi:hypothetical protein
MVWERGYFRWQRLLAWPGPPSRQGLPVCLMMASPGGLALRDIWRLRLRALPARAHGDAEVYNQLRDRYRDMAKTLGYEGHIAWAEAMP